MRASLLRWRFPDAKNTVTFYSRSKDGCAGGMVCSIAEAVGGALGILWILGLYMKLDLFTKWCVASQVLTDHRSLAPWVCSPCLGHGISATASFCFPRCLKVLNPIKVVL